VSHLEPSEKDVASSPLHSAGEEIGFIVPIGEWVIRHGMYKTAAKWPGDLHDRRQYFSGSQFRSPGLLRSRALRSPPPLLPTRLEIENLPNLCCCMRQEHTS